MCLVVDKSKLQNEPLGVILTARFLAHFEVYLDVKKETLDEKYSDDLTFIQHTLGFKQGNYIQ